MTGTAGSSGHEVQLPEAEYILPLRWFSDDGLDELTGYLRLLSGWIRITVVDGSAPALFNVHAAAWAGLVEHRRPEVWPGRNGKVAGVMTGVRHSRKEYLVLADDDVRYTLPALRRLVALLAGADVVRPQNYFLTLPWHARWDTARTLLNRAVASDFPGTLGVRRSALEATDGYDGDVLFENLELIRTVKAAGGRELRADNLFVGRIPATAAHFRGQRIRQAYDDFAQPVRLAVELTLLPLIIFAARRPARWIPLLAAAVAMAEAGRRRKNGRAVFPPTSALWVPCWLLERAVCIWLALGQRLAGGVKYAGNRMPTAGTPRYQLRRKYAAQRSQHIPSPLPPRDQERNFPCSQPSRSSQPSQPSELSLPSRATSS
ncbi:glycosyltransferase [Arthrobacter crystallopoietes]|uniref:glycosyltransferase n=1 Tax=Crystallibacter crystallopoietes TaxID=37928 RepID=UPI001FC942B9|nr:glycosyltransferase family 2 protein [Arthrobacter crystallopoietes]